MWLLLFSTIVFSQQKQIVQIKGFAPQYVGEQISVLEIQDYFSMKESTIATTTVNSDSTFSLSFFCDETQKVHIEAGKNRSLMYVQPNGQYELFLPGKNQYDPYRPNGNQIEITFLSLDTTDINYKILSFQRWMDEFVSNYYYLKNIKPIEFSKQMDAFKTSVENEYKSDTSNYFKVFVKFSIASLDNIQFAAERNRYEKHDFYLKFNPVLYRNDAYMEYVNSFYEKMMSRLGNETNEKVYKGVLKSSPTLIMKALGAEYTLINMRLREMIMLKSLSEEFHSKEFPQTNILTILDSVANHALFKANAQIAVNLKSRLTELTPGGKAPDFSIQNLQKENRTLSSFSGKHVYIHFFDPTSQKNTIELEPLKKLHNTYNQDVRFVTIITSKTADNQEAKSIIAQIPWEICIVSEENAIWTNYKVATKPSYVLLDALGYVVSAPALGPLPDGLYQTIDKTFYYVKRTNEEYKKKER